MRISDWSSDVCSSDLVIAVTDTPTSPLVPPSRHAFFIPHASSYFSNSMGAYIVFCEALLNLVAREMGPAALDALSRREHLIPDEGRDTVEPAIGAARSEEHTSELQSLMRISYAVFCLKKKNQIYNNTNH